MGLDITLKTTTYDKQIPFLDSRDVRYIRGAITMEAAAVTADGNGLKKLLAGAFIGKSGSKYRKYTAAIAATVTLAPAGVNNDIVIIAKEGGTAGNAIKVQLKDPGANNATLKVTIETDTIVVSLATDGAGAITSTANQVNTAINAALYVKDLVTAANAAGNDGTGVVTAIAATPLAGGTAANVIPTLILAEDVLFTSFSESGGVTHSDKVVTAIDRGRVIASRLPVAPDSYVKQNMPGIAWA